VPRVLASVATFAIDGIETREVTVEVDVRLGLSTFTVVGLPDRAVRESRERVRAALQNSGLDFPQKRLTVNLAPAYLRKVGPSFDLAIAVGVLAANGQVPPESVRGCAVSGELSLGGELRPALGALATAVGAERSGYSRLIVAEQSASEAALVTGLEVIAVPSLGKLADLLHGRWRPIPAIPREREPPVVGPDLADVRGQEDAKRALEIAAAGGHNLLMIGPPGAGKTMLARRLPGIMPPPRTGEALEITQIRGVAGLGDGALATERPFRAPHHTISAQGLVGGGGQPRPGEVTLAHRGVLFLDELPEFQGAALDALRQPLEERRVEVMRGQRSLCFPASFALVAACNECPCGRPPDDCNCTPGALGRYARRLSGPLLDRIDLVCRVEPVAPVRLVGNQPSSAERSRAVRERVVAARARQESRLAGSGVSANAEMDARLTRKHVPAGGRVASRLLSLPDRGLLTGRGYDRILRVARTIADLDGRDRVAPEDVDEALGYRVSALDLIAA
jgi:magnesium chelatase family protein